MNGKSNLGSDISKSMTRCRMLVTITQVTAQTYAKQMNNPQRHSRINTGTNSKDDISNKLTLMHNYYSNPNSYRVCAVVVTSWKPACAGRYEFDYKACCIRTEMWWVAVYLAQIGQCKNDNLLEECMSHLFTRLCVVFGNINFGNKFIYIS